MEIEKYDIEGPLLLKPKVFRDHRGFFMEAYNKRVFEELGIISDFVQDNHSKSVKHTLRGLHYQVNRWQAKLVRVIQGEIWDVAVDIRPNSPTYGKSVCATLTCANQHQFYIPVGFAHGFQVVSETAEVIYKCSDFWSPEDERGVLWSDPQLGLNWPNPDSPILSDKDLKHPEFKNLRLD
ncbi:dTDP-4-dehydrorhamnose 3,5-epimerase [Sulfidibacter corallicola]|uniref:dTDP-4-dehydrorhamnose 3,5-epimerase n=1 Tax=Sulfidibacter corallicola TaxID=2818388 RepID=A0A8A4TWX4_SULCO|nr:dTDP-4-dehydrorhamnose 3,5-epimerase [Sulfidibacter corallicola]QTD53973.1 dTDP-4-dehydrorhamnose 3,5-epimerase [Sulfidibacter corallicola]